MFFHRIGTSYMIDIQLDFSYFVISLMSDLRGVWHLVLGAIISG